MRTALLLSISFCLIQSTALAQFPSYIQATFQEEFDAFNAQYDLQGVSLAIRSADHEWVGVNGISTATDPINSDHVFAMGSVSKTITAATILQMHDDGLLNLDDEVSGHLPLTAWVTPTITIRQLLNHTSGIFNYTQHPDFGPDVFYSSSTMVTQADILNNYMQSGPFSPGQAWGYSNTNYIVLSMIIEAVAQQAYYLEARDRFGFDTNYPTLSLPPHESSTDDLAHLWIDTVGNGTYMDWQASTLSTNFLFSSAGAAGAYVASPSDLSQWTYDLYSGALLSAATMAEMIDPVPNSGGYALGTMTNTGPCDQTSFGHNGGIFYRSATYYSTTSDLAVAIITNDANLSVNLDAFVLDIFCEYSEIVGTEELQLDAPTAKLYPNPSAGAVTADISFAGNYDLTVLNVLGQAVLQRTSTSGARQLLEFTQPGAYLVRIQSGAQVAVQRLIIQ